MVMELAKHSWKQVEAFMQTCDTALVLTGATENHGTHLALGCDSFIPEKILELIGDRVNALSTPCMPFGVSDHHDGFCGTLNIGYDAFYQTMKKVFEKLYRMGIRRFIVLNGHGGNNAALARLGIEFYNRGAVTAIVEWWDLAGQMKAEWAGGHAAGQETSALLAVDESLVFPEEMEDQELIPVHPDMPAYNLGQVMFEGCHIFFPRDVKSHYPAGWSGADLPKTASKQWGEDMLQAVADYVVDLTKAMSEIQLADRT